MGLCKEVFLGASRQIKLGWRHLFPDFAKQNQEKDVSIQRIFCRRRRQKTFFTTPRFLTLPAGETKKDKKTFSIKRKALIFASAFENVGVGSVAQLDRASDYGSEG